MDTLFIVLRKRKLIHLHWIHHILTLCYCWFSSSDLSSPIRWFVNMNYFVHSFMYAYFALAATRIFRIPKWVNITITTAQIAQMFIGLWIAFDTLKMKLRMEPVDIALSSALAGFALYFLFFCLFINFFVRTYLLPRPLNLNKNKAEHKKLQ